MKNLTCTVVVRQGVIENTGMNPPLYPEAAFATSIPRLPSSSPSLFDSNLNYSLRWLYFLECLGKTNHILRISFPSISLISAYLWGNIHASGERTWWRPFSHRWCCQGAARTNLSRLPSSSPTAVSRTPTSLWMSETEFYSCRLNFLALRLYLKSNFRLFPFCYY